MSKPLAPIINWNNPLTKGLIGDYPIFERGGGVTNNMLKYNQGIITNATFVNDLFGTCLSFDGATAYVDTGANTNLELLNSYSLNALIKINSASVQNAIMVRGKSGSNAREYLLIVNNTGKLLFQRHDGSTAKNINGSTTLSVGVWYNVAVTFDGTNGVIYLNAVPDSSPTNISQTIASDAARSMEIGAGLQSAGRSFFMNGFIAYARLWKRVLATSEIKQLYVNPWQIYNNPLQSSLNTGIFR